MQSINTTAQEQAKIHPKYIRTHLNWLLPTGLATAGILVLMMYLPITTQNHVNKTPVHPQNNKKIQLSQVNMKSLSQSLESNLMNPITAEKKALQADLEYFKSLFSLKKT